MTTNPHDLGVQHRCATLERQSGLDIEFTETFVHPRHSWLPGGPYYCVHVGPWDADEGLEPVHLAWSKFGFMSALDELAEQLGFGESDEETVAENAVTDKGIAA